MPEEPSTYGLDPQRLARILALGAEEVLRQGDGEDRQTEKLLCRMLAERLPLRRRGASAGGGADRGSAEAPAPCDQAIGSVLLAAGSDTGLLQAAKESAKQLVRGGGPGSQRAAATALYYAAIASALVFHNKKISRHSYDRLEKAFADLAEKPWMAAELKRLLRQAQQACRQHERGLAQNRRTPPNSVSDRRLGKD